MTEIALKSLSFLTRKPHGEIVQSRQIGAHLGVSATYVAKALQPLVRVGWLRSVKGRAGGWLLQVEPASKTVLQAVEALEPFGQWRRCPIGHEDCSEGVDCPFHATWCRAVEGFSDSMRATTVDRLPDFLPACYERRLVNSQD